MRSTSKNDYIKMFCEKYCENNDVCDKKYIYINEISDKTTHIGCSSYKMKEAKNK